MLRSIVVLLITGLILIMVTGCGPKEDNSAEVEKERIAVEAVTVDYGSLTVSKSYSGTIEGIVHASLTAKLGETVEKTEFKLGDRIESGQVLLTLDKGGPSSQYRQAEAIYLNAKRLVNKYENLYSEGAISENDLDQARTEFNVAQANFKAARELVNVIAPFDGEVTAINVNVGDQVYLGQHLATVSRTEKIRVEIGVDAEDVDYVQVGDTVEISMRGMEKASVMGTVKKVARSADPETRAFAVEVIADNQDNTLKVGSFATVKMQLYTVDNVVLVPKESVQIRKGIPKLFKLNGDTAQSVEVEIGVDDGQSIQIMKGVSPGDRVVYLGQAFLSDGALVNVVN